jgi:hypothetical protein
MQTWDQTYSAIALHVLEDFETDLAGGMFVDEVRVQAPLRCADEVAFSAPEMGFRPVSIELLLIGEVDLTVTIWTEMVIPRVLQVFLELCLIREHQIASLAPRVV